MSIVCVKMATGYVGRVGEFDNSKETFRAYCDRMELFFEANDLDIQGGEANAAADAKVRRKRKAIFLTEIGAETFTLLDNLLAPRKAKDVAMVECVTILEKHFNPAPLEIAESFHFGTRVRKQEESIGDFIVALKKLSIHCNFGTHLDRALRDRFVCGLNHERIQHKLLNMADLSFQKACDTARAMEMAEQQAREFVPRSTAVHKVDKQPSKGQSTATPKEKCKHCNSVKHRPTDCKWKDATCYKCQQPGHIVPACTANVPYKKGKMHVLEDESTEEALDSDAERAHATQTLDGSYNMREVLRRGR